MNKNAKIHLNRDLSQIYCSKIYILCTVYCNKGKQGSGVRQRYLASGGVQPPFLCCPNSPVL